MGFGISHMGRQHLPEVERSFHVLYDIRTESEGVYKDTGLTFAYAAVIFTVFQLHASPISLNIFSF